MTPDEKWAFRAAVEIAYEAGFKAGLRRAAWELDAMNDFAPTSYGRGQLYAINRAADVLRTIKAPSSDIWRPMGTGFYAAGAEAQP